MSSEYSDVVETAREYYNSEDADNFYFLVWGGEDLHIGIYYADDESIYDASQRTMDHMIEHVDLGPDDYVLDIGGGYGGSARFLAKRFGCRVVVLNLSEVENERDREMNKEQGLDHLIEVVDGDFENLNYPDETFTKVWSQDAILHSGNRERVVAEAARVLKPGGSFIFTDPMQADSCPEGVIQPILDRIHLDTLGSPSFYKQAGEKAGLEFVDFESHHDQLPRHYGRVREETIKADESGILEGKVSKAYIERMLEGLNHWIEGGRNGYLNWGIFHFRKKG